jgi:2,3-bisphosphoglycerate-independent phosphoglycerate mutase
LIILDGYGLAPASPSNAISLADTPVLDGLFASYPHARLSASGEDVGLPDGQIGNSEVGHTNIGAGRVVYQDLPRITKSIADGDFFENSALLAAVENAKTHNSALHIMGLLSDGGVHSHNSHAFALLELAQRHGVERVYLHCFLDGRDVPPKSGLEFVREARAQCEKYGAKLATIAGRYYAMDRDEKYDRLALAFDALTGGGHADFISDAVSAVQRSYDNDVTDEFMLPVVCERGAEVRENDSVIFFNFRGERARELTREFVDSDFPRVCFVCMTEYDAAMPNVAVAFPPKNLKNTFGEFISGLGMTQLRIAETTKYAHVTFFFNGGAETVFAGEERVLIPTADVATFDLKPEMSAFEIAAEVTARIKSGKYDVIILNYANCDMVGHTGNISAAVSAVEAVDHCVGLTLQAVRAAGGVAVVTADHGNADQMRADDGVTPHTAHTTNPVPFILIGAAAELRAEGRLCDIAPTLLDILGIEQPEEMTGESLIV